MVIGRIRAVLGRSGHELGPRPLHDHQASPDVRPWLPRNPRPPVAFPQAVVRRAEVRAQRLGPDLPRLRPQPDLRPPRRVLRRHRPTRAGSRRRPVDRLPQRRDPARRRRGRRQEATAM